MPGVVALVDDRWTALAVVRELLAEDGGLEGADGADGADAADGGTALQRWLHRVCDIAALAVPADGVAVSLMADGSGLAVAAASDPVADALGSLQFTLGEGPCVDAFAAGHPVLVPDLAAVPGVRWPAFTSAAQALDVRSVFALPLRIGAAHLGILTLHRCAPAALDRRATALALAFAAVTVGALVDAQAGLPEPVAADGDGAVHDVLGAHYVVYQAQGMTMVDLGVSLVDALARLRARAFADGRPLHEVAQDVVAGRLRLEPDLS